MGGGSQHSMAAGVIDDSFYSRVEKDKSKIRAESLLAILNIKKVSIIEFLVGFGDLSHKDASYKERIVNSLNNRDAAELQKVINDSSFTNNSLKQVAQLMINKIQNQRVNIKPLLKSSFFKEEVWDTDTLWILWILMIIDTNHDFSELVNLADKKFYKQEIINDKGEELLGKIKSLQIRRSRDKKDKDV